MGTRIGPSKRRSMWAASMSAQEEERIWTSKHFVVSAI